MYEIGAVVTRVGDETAGEMWSLYDGTDILNEVDPRFGKNIASSYSKSFRKKIFSMCLQILIQKVIVQNFLKTKIQICFFMLVEENDKGIVVQRS